MSTDPLKVVTETCRISFPVLFEPQQQVDENGKTIEGSAKKFSVLLLIPKTATKTIAAIKAAQQAALEQGKSTKFGGKIPKDWKNTLHDCDEKDDLEQYPEREGHYRITVSANENYRPGVVDQSLNPILDPAEVYSGCYMRAALRAFPYKHPSSGPGISFGLSNIQKVKDGEPLGGVVSKASDDFDAIDEDDLL